MLSQAHRLFHYKGFYKHVHKIHHEYSAPFGLAAVRSPPSPMAPPLRTANSCGGVALRRSTPTPSKSFPWALELSSPLLFSAGTPEETCISSPWYVVSLLYLHESRADLSLSPTFLSTPGSFSASCRRLTATLGTNSPGVSTTSFSCGAVPSEFSFLPSSLRNLKRLLTFLLPPFPTTPQSPRLPPPSLPRQLRQLLPPLGLDHG